MPTSKSISGKPSTTIPDTFGKDFFTPNCPYSHECTSKGYKCSSCKHNKSKDHYEPKYPPYTSPGTVPWPYSPTVTFTLAGTGQ